MYLSFHYVVPCSERQWTSPFLLFAIDTVCPSPFFPASSSASEVNGLFSERSARADWSLIWRENKDPIVQQWFRKGELPSVLDSSQSRDLAKSAQMEISPIYLDAGGGAEESPWDIDQRWRTKVWIPAKSSVLSLFCLLTHLQNFSTFFFQSLLDSTTRP